MTIDSQRAEVLNEDLVLRFPKTHQQGLANDFLHVNLMLLVGVDLYDLLLRPEGLVALNGILKVLPLLDLVFAVLVQFEDAFFILHARTHLLDVFRVGVNRFPSLIRIDLQTQDSDVFLRV